MNLQCVRNIFTELHFFHIICYVTVSLQNGIKSLCWRKAGALSVTILVIYLTNTCHARFKFENDEYLFGPARSFDILNVSGFLLKSFFRDTFMEIRRLVLENFSRCKCKSHCWFGLSFIKTPLTIMCMSRWAENPDMEISRFWTCDQPMKFHLRSFHLFKDTL